MRLILLRAVALRQCFLDIARPSRAGPSSFSLHSTVNHLSRLRVAFSNTRPNAAAFRSRQRFPNRCAVLRSKLGILPVALTTAWDYGVNRTRPLARRCLRIRRPALVAIRARNPCVRARFNLLGWYVRFICLIPESMTGELQTGQTKGRQAYAEASNVSIERWEHSNFGARPPCDSAVWRYSDRRYRLPDLLSQKKTQAPSWGPRCRPK